jgi:hypothetical protein
MVKLLVLLNYIRTKKTDKNFTIHAGKKFVYENLHVTKSHGTVFALICFVSHKYPILHLLTFQTPIFMALKKIKSIKSIVGISPTMVLLFHLPFVYLKM